MKAKINLKNIKGYLQAHYREILKDFDFLPKHIQEQAEWRLKQVAEKSPECLERDSCKECGCQVSSKVFEDRACSNVPPCYPQLMNEEEWSQTIQLEKVYKAIDNIMIYGKDQQDSKHLVTSGPMIIRDFSKEETLADLMQNNPHLTKEELLYWCPEFQDTEYIVGYDDVPGIKGTRFKIKLSKDQFSGNITPEQKKSN